MVFVAFPVLAMVRDLSNLRMPTIIVRPSARFLATSTAAAQAIY